MKSFASSRVAVALGSMLAFSASGGAHGETTDPVASGGPSALSPSANNFGATGQWVYSLSDPSEFPFILNKTGSGPWHILVQPSGDIFIAPNVSVGGLLKVERAGGGTTVGIGARAGYDIRFTSLVSLWIRGGLLYQHFSPGVGASSSQTQLDIIIPALFHLVPHFFVGVGPTVAVILQGGGDTTIGLSAIIGGYL